MKTKEILIKARELIAQPEHWTQYEMARDVDGNPVEWDAREAYSFCSLGAIDRASNWQNDDAVEMAFTKLKLWARENTNCDMITEFNDHTTHAKVIAAFDEVIQSCE